MAKVKTGFWFQGCVIGIQVITKAVFWGLVQGSSAAMQEGGGYTGCLVSCYKGGAEAGFAPITRIGGFTGFVKIAPQSLARREQGDFHLLLLLDDKCAARADEF